VLFSVHVEGCGRCPIGFLGEKGGGGIADLMNGRRLLRVTLGSTSSESWNGLRRQNYKKHTKSQEKGTGQAVRKRMKPTVLHKAPDGKG